MSSKTAPSDNYHRTRAASCLGESFLVEAGAGTGKTTLLMDRLKNVICDRGVPMESVVAITFTEKAAGELKSRLREELENLEQRAVGEQRERVRRALREMDRAAVSTIHSFCAALLRERPVEAGVDPGFRVADEVEADEIFEDAWEIWLHERMTPDNARLRPAFELGAGLDSVKELAREFIRNRDTLSWSPETLPECDPADFLETMRGKLSALAELAERDLRDSEDRLAAEITKLKRWVESCEERLSAGSPASPSSALGPLELKAKGRGNAGNWSSKQSLAQARELLATAAEEVERARGRLLHNAVVGLTLELRGLVDIYQSAKRERGVLDFDDLLIGARNLLRDSDEARGYFKGKFEFILIDEFQDTDPLQAELAFFLAERRDSKSDSWEEVKLEPGKLFLVGDPKQSIYRFRRADIELYEMAKEVLTRSGDVLQISVNFRSTPGVIEPVNLAFREAMVPPEEGSYQPEYVALDSYRRSAGPGLTALTAAGSLPEGLSSDEKRAFEASAIAWSIASAVGSPGWKVCEGANGPKRPVRYGDIAVLFWATTGLGIYEEALRSWGIPYRVAGGKAFYSRGEVQALLCVLAAIESPHDGIAVVGALRSPFFGVSDEEIFLHWKNAGGLDYLEVSGAGYVGKAFETLRELRSRRNSMRLAAFLDGLFEMTGVLPALYRRFQGEQRVANLLKISAMAETLERSGPVTFKRFVRWVGEQDRRGVEEGESPIQEPGDNFVTVLTVHKAKGLEFPVVVLPGLWTGGRSGAGRVIADRRNRNLQINLAKGLGLVTAGWESASERESEVLDAERIRLLYVAMTRARDKLVIPCLFGLDNAGAYAPQDSSKKAESGRGPGVSASASAKKKSRAAKMPIAHLEPLLRKALTGRPRWAERLEIPGRELERRREGAFRVKERELSKSRADYGELDRAWISSLENVLGALAVPEPVTSPTDLLEPLGAGVSGAGGHGAGGSGPEGSAARGRGAGVAAGRRPGRGVGGGDGATGDEATGDEGATSIREAGSGEGDTGRRVGALVHSVLEVAGRWDAELLRDLARSMGGDYGLGEEALGRAVDMLRRFSTSRFADRIRGARTVRKEVPFCVALEGPGQKSGARAPGAMVEGAADLVMEEDDGWRVVDFKTDAIDAGGVAGRAHHYRLQGACYALCLSRVLKRPVLEVIFYFLHPQEAHVFKVDERLLRDAAAAVTERVGA